MVVDYLFRSIVTCAQQGHLLIMDTFTVASTVRALEGYLVIGGQEKPPYMAAVTEVVTISQLTQLESTL